jgi:hypothetical protein
MGQAWIMRLAVVPAVVVIPVLLFSAPAHAATDEDQVRAVLAGMNGAYNRSDFDGFASHLCKSMRQGDGFESGWRQSRAADGPTRITVNSVEVSGDPADQAVAVVRFEAANRPDAKTLEIDFERVDAEWKACRYDPTLAV